MKEQIFLDLSGDVGSIKEAEVATWRFKKYRIETLGDEVCLVGEGMTDGWRNLLTISSPEILLDLLQTVKEPPPAIWSKDILGEYIPSSSIIEWCEKYGLLCEDAYIRDYEFEINGEPGYKTGWHGFKLYPARRQIAQMYEQFFLWQGLVNEDVKLLRNNANQAFITDVKKYGNDQDLIKAIKENLPYTTNVCPNFMLDFSGDLPQIKIGFSSLMEVCRYQLLMLMTRDKTETRKHLKDCNNPLCRKLFWAKHGRQKYCDNCNPKQHYEQTKRGVRSKKEV